MVKLLVDNDDDVDVDDVDDDDVGHLAPAAAAFPSSAMSSVITVSAPKLVRYCQSIIYDM